ncbi:MAG: alpha/beta hydrolase [Thomasclavelia sp.]|nr:MULTISPECIES: alpha/beta hydrolase [Thomasclavelia]
MNNKGKKTVTSLAVLAGLVSGVGALNMFVNRTVKSIIYRHHKDDDKPSILETKYKSKNIYIKNKQDIRLRGILIEETNATKTLIILHPFALEAKDMSLYVPFFKDRYPLWNILLVDACTHGQSDGYIRGLGIKDVNDLVCWNDYLLKEYGKEHQIILYGKETGANTILKAASKHLLKNVKAIISDGAYTSVYDILAYRIVKDYKVVKFPTIQMIQHKIKNEIKINIKESYPLMLKHNDIPTLFIHMKNDDFVPLDMVYPLYNANRGSKELFVLKDEHYLYELNETDDFKNTLKNFIFEYVND